MQAISTLQDSLSGGGSYISRDLLVQLSNVKKVYARQLKRKVHESISFLLAKDKFRKSITLLFFLPFVCLPFHAFLIYLSISYFSPRSLSIFFYFLLLVRVLFFHLPRSSVTVFSIYYSFYHRTHSNNPLVRALPLLLKRDLSSDLWLLRATPVRRLTLCMQASSSCKVGHRNAPARNCSRS